MVKRKQTYIVLLISLFIVYIGVELFRPKEIDWSISFEGNSKSPYGCNVLRKELPLLVEGVSVVENKSDFYRSLNKYKLKNPTVFVVTQQFEPNNTDINSLLQYVGEGNNAFISAQSFNHLFGDTLKIATNQQWSELANMSQYLKLELQNKNIDKPRVFEFKKTPSYYFSKADTANTQVLETDLAGRATYIRTKFGQGFFFLHANPLVFTNFHILYSCPEYPSRSLAYLAGRPIVWDEYYKPGNITRAGTTPLRYILSQEPLRYAYILFVVTWIAFVVFVGKRRQRVVPVHHAMRNQSLDFIATVGQLYFSQRNNSDLIRKKISYFADYVQSTLYLKFKPDDKAFRADFSAKTNIPMHRVDKLFDSVLSFDKAKHVTDDQLLSFVAELDQIQHQHQPITNK